MHAAANGIGDDVMKALEASLNRSYDKQQAKAAAGDRFDEAAFDAAAVDGRVPSALLMEISSWQQALRDGTTKLDLHAAGKRIGDVGARALAALLEKNTTLKTLILESARLCARWRGVDQRSRFLVLGRAPQGVGSPCRARGSSFLSV